MCIFFLYSLCTFFFMTDCSFVFLMCQFCLARSCVCFMPAQKWLFAVGFHLNLCGYCWLALSCRPDVGCHRYKWVRECDLPTSVAIALFEMTERLIHQRPYATYYKTFLRFLTNSSTKDFKTFLKIVIFLIF